MGNITNAQYSYDKIEAILANDAESLSYGALEEAASLLREEADRLMARIQQKQVANDTLKRLGNDLQDVLEMRYGSGFAQWVIDSICPPSRRPVQAE